MARLHHHSMTEDEFWDEDELVEGHPTRKRKKERRKRSTGCPENNNGAHVYVWTTEGADYSPVFYEYFGFHKYEHKVCCGCKKEGKRRYTEEYNKKRIRSGRFMWEWDDKGYKKLIGFHIS